MDQVLIEYLRSGKSWVLVGSGPSTEMGYPSWGNLASFAIKTMRAEQPTHDFRSIQKANEKRDYPQVFELAKKSIGGPRLLQALREKMRPTNAGVIYKYIAEWPVPVYLTTNYDDEIQHHLTKVGASYTPYTNSEDHMGQLLPEMEGVIVKLHGDLRSEEGLILTNSQYTEIEESGKWQYWRTKLTSIFQMQHVIVVGHSLTDRNIRAVLAAAKLGAGVERPICWIAPDVPPATVKEYLERYRIRVISYFNKDGRHKALVRLIESVSQFVPPRTDVRFRSTFPKREGILGGGDASAAGFYVFNKVSKLADADDKRVEVINAAIFSVAPQLNKIGAFTLDQMFSAAGWPTDIPVPSDFAGRVETKSVEEGLIQRQGDKFILGHNTLKQANESRVHFDHLKDRFKKAIEIRVRRLFSQLTAQEARTIAADLEASLTIYFREGGLSLTTTLFSDPSISRTKTLPPSIVRFINDASTKYDSLLMRQAFSGVSIDVFINADRSEKDYLGRISQGFFAFHSLGVFGDVAIGRLNHAKETVWLVDSNVQIFALALYTPTNVLFAEVLNRLREAGIRLFTTDKLFRETFSHLTFALNQVRTYGESAPEILLAASGQLPYRKSNQFLQGFVNWQAATGKTDWHSYLFDVFGRRNPNYDDAYKTLEMLGVEIIEFDVWPGFDEEHYRDADKYTQRIVDVLMRNDTNEAEIASDAQPPDVDPSTDPYKKADPESEALVIVKHERTGGYNMLGEKGERSDCWFISDTSVLNLIDRDLGIITWPSEGFIRFASTLHSNADPAAAEQAFQAILVNCAQAGLNLLDEDTINAVLGSRIDQDTLQLAEELQIYKQTIEEEYGDAPESVLKRVRPVDRYVAAIQMANQAADNLIRRAESAETSSRKAVKRASTAEKELAKVAKDKEKLDARKKAGKRKQRRQQSGKRKGKRK